EGQKEIFYLTGEDTNMLKNSPLLEGYKAKGIEVLLLDEEVDAIIVPSIGTYKELPLSAINHADMDEDKEALKESEEAFKELTIKIKELLKDDVKDVKVTARLKTSPSCLVYDKNDPDFAMQQMLKQMGQMDMPEIKPILEINPEHAIFTKLNENKDSNKLADISSLLLDLAKLNEGMKIEDTHGFSQKINKLIENSI
ncbi:MAG TPA: molecular chaperone HtpG, partial [Campylobacterales bacterium]|nr:molecular chaperone HtpG [Campylobacterales bacterium]